MLPYFLRKNLVSGEDWIFLYWEIVSSKSEGKIFNGSNSQKRFFKDRYNTQSQQFI